MEIIRKCKVKGPESQTNKIVKTKEGQRDEYRKNNVYLSKIRN